MTTKHAPKIDICVIMGKVVFFNFQNASPRKCSSRFPRNSTHLRYSGILQTGRVSASVLTPTHLPWRVNLAEKLKFPLWERSIFCNFENPSPRQCSGSFLRNSTQWKYYRILHTDRVSASVLIDSALAMTCEHDRKIEMSLWESRFFAILKIFAKLYYAYKLHPTRAIA